MFRRRTRIAALMLGLGATVASVQTFAHGGDCMGDGNMRGDAAQGRFADRAKAHQQRLHDALKLSAQQESAWTKFQESSPFGKDIKRPDPAEFANLTAPERADKMLEMQKQRQEAMTKHLTAMKDFYAQLSPEQKKTFDDQTQMGRKGRHGHHERRGGPDAKPADKPASAS